ncbi:MAG TPA: PepSY-associated TM helix domain-containing protein [Polyangiaceae bacterium]|nr:PepSY-associated TM helix domain-containing protein [Polyangiaceae bacterium]
MSFKLTPSTYKAWWDLHAWAGVVASLLAHVMFFFGVWTLFFPELLAWQEPRGPVPTLPEVDRTLARAVAQGDVSPQRLRVFLPTAHAPGFSATYTGSNDEREYRHIERHGLVEPRSGMADFFYGMHYLQPPAAPKWLYVVAGLVSGVLVLVTATGLLIQLRFLFAQVHQFRAKQGIRVVISDAHKVLGTLGLPFVAVYAFTGAWMGLDSVLVPRLTEVAFRGSEQAATLAQFGPETPKIQAAQVPARPLPLAELLARAKRELPPADATPDALSDCRSVTLIHHGDREAAAEFHCGKASVALRQRDGALLAAPRQSTTLLTRIGEIPYALHFVEFAGVPLRLLYALLGLAGCATILTGNWLWLERRAPGGGRWLLQRLTLAAAFGALVACTAMVCSTRLAISLRFERHAFWWSWLLVAIACLGVRSAPRLWRACSAAAGTLLVLTPLVGLLQLGNEARIVASPFANHAVDVALLCLGGACFAVSRVATQRRARASGRDARSSLGVA